MKPEVGDYEPLEHISEETAQRLLGEATEFIQAVRAFLSAGFA